MNFTRVVQRSVFRSPKPATRVRFFPRVIDLVPKGPKGTVCKTVIHGFKSHPDLFYGVSSVKVTLLIVDQSFRVRVSGYSLFYGLLVQRSAHLTFYQKIPVRFWCRLFWSGGRVVECGSMLSCYRRNPIGGSNPSRSVIYLSQPTSILFDLRCFISVF